MKIKKINKKSVAELMQEIGKLEKHWLSKHYQSIMARLLQNPKEFYYD